MKNIFRFTTLFVVFSLFISCEKEEETNNPPAARYADEIFTEVMVSTVEYSSQYGLQMDIYQPVGDAETNRPVVVLAHGGGFVAGNRSNPTMVRLGNDLAKRGYVAVSVTYRLAPSILTMLDSNSAADVVIKALSDSRAAVRYLRKTAIAEGNPYGLDPERVFMGGNSAGAVLAVHMGFLDSTDAVQPFFNTAIQANGGFEGNSGNPGYASSVKAIFSLAGGIGRTSWIDADDVPSIHFHGDEDDVVPYGCGDVFSGATGGLDVINLCGSVVQWIVCGFPEPKIQVRFLAELLRWLKVESLRFDAQDFFKLLDLKRSTLNGPIVQWISRRW
jgi:para-nitrobenzyl esterase